MKTSDVRYMAKFRRFVMLAMGAALLAVPSLGSAWGQGVNPTVSGSNHDAARRSANTATRADASYSHSTVNHGVYPKLVLRGIDDKVEGVRYLKFTAALVKEVQEQHNQWQIRAHALAEQQREIDAFKQEHTRVEALSQRLIELERPQGSPNAGGFRWLARR
jgi:hypothetical protein